MFGFLRTVIHTNATGSTHFPVWPGSDPHTPLWLVVATHAALVLSRLWTSSHRSIEIPGTMFAWNWILWHPFNTQRCLWEYAWAPININAPNTPLDTRHVRCYLVLFFISKLALWRHNNDPSVRWCLQSDIFFSPKDDSSPRNSQSNLSFTDPSHMLLRSPWVSSFPPLPRYSSWPGLFQLYVKWGWSFSCCPIRLVSQLLSHPSFSASGLSQHSHSVGFRCFPFMVRLNLEHKS